MSDRMDVRRAGRTSVVPAATLRCERCGDVFDATLDRIDCARCGCGYLVAETAPFVWPGQLSGSIWDYSASLPAVRASDRVTLGEGQTPLVRVAASRDVWAKNEGANPTRSYKDRFNAVNVSVAKALGARGLALISTGNAGVSAAAYGAEAGLDVTIVCRDGVRQSIVTEMKQFGADVRVVASKSEGQATLLAALELGDYPASRSVPALGASAFGCVGYRTIAYEIVAQLGRSPEVVALPVGGGDGISGVFDGFADLVQAGVIAELPRLIGARTSSPAAPSIAFDEVSSHATEAVMSTGGGFIDISESQIVDALQRLSGAGISAEPASATAYAALDGVDNGVCVITGSGDRWRHESEMLLSSSPGHGSKEHR